MALFVQGVPSALVAAHTPASEGAAFLGAWAGAAFSTFFGFGASALTGAAFAGLSALAGFGASTFSAFLGASTFSAFLMTHNTRVSILALALGIAFRSKPAQELRVAVVGDGASVRELAAVIGRKDIMGLYGPGSMTSTHSASPLPVVAAVENLKVLQAEELPQRAARLGEILLAGLAEVQGRYSSRLGCLHGKGLVAGIQVVKAGTKEPDPATALAVNLKCFHKGLLMFAPVGIAGECLKICPPLVISEEALRESLAVFAEACAEVLG